MKFTKLSITLLLPLSLFASECSKIFPDILSSETSITFVSKLDIESKSNELQTPTINQSRIDSKCDGSKCRATDTTPKSLKIFNFQTTTVDETKEITEDTLYDKENIPSIIITKDNTTVTFKAPSPSKGFTPTQKIGSIKVEAKNVTLVFEAGDYYIESFEAESSVTKQMRRSVSMSDTLTITPNGNTRLFIDESFYILKSGLNPMDKSLLINAKKTEKLKFPSKKQDEDIDTKKLIIYTKGNIEIDTSYEINALIYGYSDIKLSSDSQSKFRGAIHTKGKLTLANQYSFKSGEFIYDEEAVKNLWKLFSCQALPNEPDETLNNSTLLGIDDNRNGARDDVEMWIIDTYKDKHPIHIDIAMQAANAYKKVLEVPEKAVGIRSEVNGAYFCGSYYQNYIKFFNKKALVKARIDAPVYSKYFNIKKRKDTFTQYDILLSGGSYPLPEIEKMEAQCNFNTNKYEDE